MPPRRKQVTYSSRPNHAARMAHAKGERQFRTYDTSHIRPKRSPVPVVFAVVLALLVVGGIVWGVLTFMNSCAPQATLAKGESVQIVVAEGSGAQTIGSQLQEAGLIATATEFTKRVTELGAESSLRSGLYTFIGGMSVDDIIAVLKAGPAMQGTPLVIPEGYKLADTANAVADATQNRVTAEAFTAAASDASVYANDFPFLAEAETNSLEGFLFPKTYALSDDATADSIIRMMLAQYQKEVTTLDFAYPQSKGLSVYDTLKLASVVEKESTADTRARVASVFYNRLTTQGAPSYGLLQSDATTAYEVGHDPTPDEVHADTPYSTYSHAGLPPTPICSPGLESLQAVCSPEETPYYFFYFENNDQGGVDYYFSESYEEHKASFS